MKASIEREDFSERLQQALRNADYSPDSPTQLAREFNIRFTGRPITVHAGKYGPYVKHGAVNATLPKALPPAPGSLDEAVALIAEKAGKAPVK